MVMHDEQGAEMEVKDIPLIGGHPVLDFSNSWENPGLANEVNYLGDYAALAAWAVRAGLLQQARAKTLLREAKAHPLRAKAAWEKAMALRRCLLAIVHAMTLGRAPPGDDLHAVNEAIAEALDNRCIAGSTGGLAWSWKTPASMDVIWWEIALQAAALLTDAGLEGRIRTCANGVCGWVFLDLSHAGRRRWCRMGVCGTADKVRKFRERQRLKTGG